MEKSTTTISELGDDYEACTNSDCSAFQLEINDKLISLQVLVDDCVKENKYLKEENKYLKEDIKIIKEDKKKLEEKVEILSGKVKQTEGYINGVQDNALKRSDHLQDVMMNVSSLTSKTDVNSKNINELETKFDQLKDSLAKQIPPKPLTIFFPIENKLNKVSESQSCCNDKCLSNGTKCKNGHGIVKIFKDGLKVGYHSSTCDEEKDLPIMIESEKEFSDSDIPSNVPNHANVIHYMEAKLLAVEENDFEMSFGLSTKNNHFYRICSDGYYRTAEKATKLFKFDGVKNENAVYGIGQTVPPRNKPNEDKQIFITKDGNFIKAFKVKEDEDFLPHLIVKRCDVEVNFGNDETKPFVYDVNKHEEIMAGNI